MKIGINLLPLYPGKIGGLENYVRELIRNFLEVDGGRNEYYIVLNRFSYGTFDEKERTHKIKVKDFSSDDVFCEKALAEIIKNNSLDFWFCPLFNLSPKSLAIPSAITIPDLQHEHYPQFFSESVLSWRKSNLKISAELADVIFTISEFSKKDIAEKFGLSKAKITSTYLDCSESFKKIFLAKGPISKKYNIPKEYIFYPANFWPHKNHATLLGAVRCYKKKFKKNISLVLTGYDAGNLQKIEKIIKKLGIKKEVVILGHVSENDVAMLYANAKALVFPSLFEGFGIPVLEAMWQDCPVLCPKNTSFPEIGGDAVLRINEKNPNDIAEKINEIIEDRRLRESLIEKGKKARLLFSYKKCAKETLTAIEKAFSEKREMNNLKVSIITPSYNQAPFLEETIKSVASQDYPNIEYFVIDGGSTDGSVNIIKKYAKKYPFIKWVSERDSGQSEAINKGLKMCSGDIVAYLNSDDFYYPGAIKEAAKYFKNNGKIKIIYGEGMHVNEKGSEIGRYNTFLFDQSRLKFDCFICQPTVFMRREVVENIGFFDERDHSCMDYRYWIRASGHYYFNYVPFRMAASRIHPQCKTISRRSQIIRETIAMVKEHYGYVSASWIAGYADYKVSGADQILVKKKTNKFLLSAFIVFYMFKYNYKNPLKSLKDLLPLLFSTLRG